MRFLLVAAMVVLTVFAGAANADRSERLASELARYERHAGEPTDEIRQFRLYRWHPLGRYEMAVWANPGKVYLVKVQQPCSGLDFANTIGITSTGSTVMQRFDTVNFDRQRCRIASIRPVDYKALRAEERAVKASN